MPPADPALRPPAPNTAPSAACPYCALLCDDLELAPAPNQSFTIERHGCARAAQDFARAPLAPTAFVDGRAVPLAAAISAAARLLARARQPLFGGLATDVDGMRAAVDLAERCGATLDHLHGEPLAAMARILQSRGWYAATLSELRNRADVVLLVGVNLADRYENLTRRCLQPAAALDADTLAARRIVYLGATPSGAKSAGADIIKCPTVGLPAVLQVLLATLAGQRVRPARVAGVPFKTLTALATTLRAARYAAIVFAPGALAVPRDPALARLCEIVDQLNQTGRAALVPLGGDDGGQTAVSTCAWLTGYPLRITCNATVNYQPLTNATAQLLAAGSVDALLWIDAFGRNSAAPAAADPTRTIILAASRPRAAEHAAVFIPVGTPGIDHPARLVRTDMVVSLALAQQRDAGLPTVASVLRALSTAL